MKALESYRSLNGANSGYTEIQLPVLAETEKAICFDNYTGYLNHTKPVWMPKSQMQIVDGGAEFGVRYFVKNWLITKLK